MTQTSVSQICLTIYRFIVTALVVFSVLTTNMCLAESLKGNQPVGERRLNEFEGVTQEEGGTDLRIFTRQDSGKEFRLPLGGEFQVHLSENPTTGYLWTILKSSSLNIELERKEFLPSEDPDIVGAAGVRVLVLKATKPGEAILHLGLKRPWEKEDKCTGTYSLKLVVE
ncbi:MAG: protease inhibitor I42 family protein [Proteobacteria bacterium]|nr:protease inhibitor I42 family protein [Pseudomonadota bacterium]